MKAPLVLMIGLLVVLPGKSEAKGLTPEDEVVQICTIPLPVFAVNNANRLLLGTKHIYLRIRERTFGTPYTIKHTYFGGDAHLYSDDEFVKKLRSLRDEKCYPVTRPEDMDQVSYEKKMKCIADKMTAPEHSSTEDLSRTWFPVFDYHALQNNCGSMTDYLVRCSGGKIRLNANFSVGNRVPQTKKAKIVNIADRTLIETSSYGEICEKALRECEANP